MQDLKSTGKLSNNVIICMSCMSYMLGMLCGHVEYIKTEVPIEISKLKNCICHESAHIAKQTRTPYNNTRTHTRT